MMSTLTEQREAIEICLDQLEAFLIQDKDAVPKSILETAKKGCTSMAWIERRQELVRALHKLQQDAPEMAKLFEEFPGSEIKEVRRV